MTVIISIIYLLFLVAQNWLDWYEILNVEADKVERLNFLVTVLFGFFCLSFVFRLLGNVFMAKQLSAANDAVAFAGNLLSLLVICACTKLFPSSLMLVGCVLAGSPLIVFIIATPFAYSVYKSIAPSFGYVRFDYFRPLLSLGVKFMIIQVAVLVLYMSSNLIISHLFGPQEVTPYNIAFKLFSAVSMGFTIIITPLVGDNRCLYQTRIFLDRKDRETYMPHLVIAVCRYVRPFGIVALGLPRVDRR